MRSPIHGSRTAGPASWPATLALVFLASVLAGCAPDDGAASGPSRVVVDTVGRSVELPATVRSIAVLGGAARLLSYAGCADMLVAVTDLDKSANPAMPYSVVNAERFSALPSSGSGGSNDMPYVEALVDLEPDVVFGLSEERVREVAEKTGIPALCLTANGPFDGSLAASLRVIGAATGTEARCEEVIAYVEACAADLEARSRDIPDGERPSVYAGAINFRGAHGFDGTMARYPPFVAIGADNVADRAGVGGAFLVDPEQVLAWDPDVIFLNPANIGLVHDDYRKNRAFYDELTAVREGRLYAQLSYNYNYTNIEIAVADAYYAGSVLYPERFADVDISAKTDDICRALLGEPFYGRLEAAGLVFGPVSIGD
jgi:iron complex transport system substrate-binding protein